MEWAAEADIFLGEPPDEGQRVNYTRGDAFDSCVADAGHVLGDKLASVKNLIAKLRPLSSRKAEWVATAYGSWNDFIKDGVVSPSDEQITNDIYTHWHISKRDVPEKDWRWALRWLRDNNVIPTGKGPRVAAGPTVA
jgi:type I restriction enzyme S subunit